MYWAYIMKPLTLIKLSYSSTSLITFFFTIHWFGNNGIARVTLPENATIPAIIVFGDSIMDQGANNNLNTLTKANFSPYGKDFVSGKSTGRFSNNRTPADMFAEQLGIKKLLPAYLDPSLDEEELLTGVSFASGGCGYDSQTAKIVSVLSFTDQLQQFKEYIEKVKRMVGEGRTQNILANSLFLVVAGTDDIANTYYTIGIRRLQYDILSYTELIVSSASKFIQDIYQLGARRIAVFGVPPIGCLPSQRTLNDDGIRVCREEYNKASQLYNIKLQQELEDLKQTNVQSRIVYFDIYNSILSIIKNPHQYGLQVVDRGCCGTGNIEVSILCNHLIPTCHDDSKYFFWDSFHPTDKGYNILVDQLLPKYINDFF